MNNKQIDVYKTLLDRISTLDQNEPEIQRLASDLAERVASRLKIAMALAYQARLRSARFFMDKADLVTAELYNPDRLQKASTGILIELLRITHELNDRNLESFQTGAELLEVHKSKRETRKSRLELLVNQTRQKVRQ